MMMRMSKRSGDATGLSAAAGARSQSETRENGIQERGEREQSFEYIVSGS